MCLRMQTYMIMSTKLAPTYQFLSARLNFNIIRCRMPAPKHPFWVPRNCDIIKIMLKIHRPWLAGLFFRLKSKIIDIPPRFHIIAY